MRLALFRIIWVEHLYLEIKSVGGGLWGGFANTNKLKVMKYQEAANGLDGESWREEIDKEHNIMLENNTVCLGSGNESIPAHFSLLKHSSDQKSY